MNAGDRRALLSYGAAVLVLTFGVAMAFARFPGGYDWSYTVISKLASGRQNPEGSRWMAGSLLVAVLFLVPVVRNLGLRFTRSSIRPGRSIRALWVGALGAGILGIEGLFDLQFSRHLYKLHEIVAIATFLGFYGGVLGLYLHRVREAAAFLLPALLVVIPLCAVGITQTILYFDQRDLGWVSTDWRELGVPLWLSFAFWQWLAVAFLGIGLGYLVAARQPGDAPPRDPLPSVEPPPSWHVANES